MNPFNYLAAFEFSKYSSCFEVMNRIASEAQISVFEVSPTPSGGILILVSSAQEPLVSFYKQNADLCKQTLIGSCLIQNLKAEVLDAYLSQNTVTDISNLNFYETNSLCEGLTYCQQLVTLGADIIDFRILRSVHNRAIIVYSGPIIDAKSVEIKNPTLFVKKYFQVLK